MMGLSMLGALSTLLTGLLLVVAPVHSPWVPGLGWACFGSLIVFLVAGAVAIVQDDRRKEVP